MSIRRGIAPISRRISSRVRKLIDAGADIGIVTGIVGLRRFACGFGVRRITPARTPMAMRRDAAVAMFRFAIAVARAVPGGGHRRLSLELGRRQRQARARRTWCPARLSSSSSFATLRRRSWSAWNEALSALIARARRHGGRRRVSAQPDRLVRTDRHGRAGRSRQSPPRRPKARAACACRAARATTR